MSNTIGKIGKVRVRFAPSPTGPLHIGGVRTALYNYLFAKKHKGDFILRIEDTDQTRYVHGAEDYIIESLKWCKIIPDEGQGFGGNYGPYRQSERKDIYRQYAEQLVNDGYAYYAFDTAEELDRVHKLAKQANTPNWQYNVVTRASMKNSLTVPRTEVESHIANGSPYVIRIKLPHNEEVKFEDIVRGWGSVNTNNMDDKVLFKSDGMPTYHLAKVVDDKLMNISHVIRGEEWLSSIPLHILLYRYLGWEESRPQFVHLPLILKPEGKGKLSKRDGNKLGFPVFPLQWKNPETDQVFSGYKQQGYFAEAFINMLALLGWNPGTQQELFSMRELIETFSLRKVNKACVRYDHNKAKWFNQQYLRVKSDEELGKLLVEKVENKGVEVALEYATKVASVMKKRAHFIDEIVTKGDFFFQAPTTYDKKAIDKKWDVDTHHHLEQLKEHFSLLQHFDAKNIEMAFKAYLTSNNLSFGKVGPGFRLAITGKEIGPSIFDICAIVGKKETLRRLETALEKLFVLNG